MPLDFAGALGLPRFPDFWLVPPAFVTVVGLFGLQNADGVWVCTGSDWFFWFVPPAFVTVVGYFGLQNVGEVYGSRRTYGCVLRLAM